MTAPVGDAVTLEALSLDPYPLLAELRRREPVAWIPALGGWLVTSREACIQVMGDAATFTVDDPRFSTAQVVGPSMLSLDGNEHRRHRDPFAAALRRASVRERFTERVATMAHRIATDLAPDGCAEVRRDLAGPLAVMVVAALLDLPDVDSATLLGWYDAIVASVDRISAGGGATIEGARAFDALADRVGQAVEDGDGLLHDARSTLTTREVVSNAAVMMFGGIETSEGMTTSVFWHVLSTPGALGAVRTDPALIDRAIEESLRLEPAAGRVDRYATRDVELGPARIRRGDLVIVSLTAANRDPAYFVDPDRFDLARPESPRHVTFARGPHACIGLHLARLETRAAMEACLSAWPDMLLATDASPPTGLVFRKPRALPVTWTVSS